jgi:D-alanyl-D-alanine dipeptidase
MAAALAFIAASGCATDHHYSRATIPAGPSPLGGSRQLVLAVSEDWGSSSAVLQCFARDGSGQPWKAAGGRIPANIGRTGLAWGRGVDGEPPLSGPVKREGDGKAPAGVFELPFAFGYAPKEKAKDVKLPYLPLTSDVVGVDDANSKYYNRLVRISEVPAKDWNSAETMRRDDGLYEWGVLVAHNTSPTLPSAGSCIFLHIWRGEGKPTAGCTAISRQDMIRLATWLEPAARPLLVQLPRQAYQRLATPWRLP